jgi:hypothetical protein
VDDGRATASEYELAQINHYFAKSFQEFALKKLRGRGGGGLSAPQRDFSNYLWGQESGSLTGGLPENIRNALNAELQHLLELPGIAEAAKESELITRTRIALLEKEMNLRSIFQSVVFGEAPTY